MQAVIDRAHPGILPVYITRDLVPAEKTVGDDKSLFGARLVDKIGLAY